MRMPVSAEQTRRRFLKHAGVAVCSAVGGSALALDPPRDTAPPAWKAGLARVVITPDKAVWLAGYGTKRVPDGKLHDLWMKALALEDHRGHRAVLVTSDFQGIPKGVSDRVFAAIREKFGLQRAQV